MIPEALHQRLESALGMPVTPIQSVGGGCIARATRIEVGGYPCFLKWGSGDVARSFVAEAEGLRALREAGSPLVIPDIKAFGVEESGVPGFLVMEWIEEGRPALGFWEDFGRGLAALHRHQGQGYGFAHDNFIGSTPQENGWYADWPAFWWEHRMMPQVDLARRNGLWQHAWDPMFERLLNRLGELLPEHPERSILHGDLWSGNYLVSAGGRPVLIDPAAYYGHREADLAMTELFGGFDRKFYAAYRSAWPLEPGYEVRREVYNLYHLMNHLNLFGAGYASSVASILRRFSG